MHVVTKMAVIRNYLLLVLLILSSRKAFTQSIHDKILFGTTEFFYSKTISADFYEARDFCFQNGGDMVSIDTEAIHGFIVEWTSNSTLLDFWLGMRKDNTGTFKWLKDSAALTFTNWEDDEDLTDDLYKCAMQKGVIHTWVVGNCGVKNSVVMCEREEGQTDPITTPSPSPLGYCPNGYFGFDGQEKCFQVNIRTAATGVTWNEARDLCKSGHGFQPDLASFHDAKEIALVATHLSGRPMSLWIGAQQKEDGDQWTWSDNSRTSFTNWGTNQPTTYPGGSCAEMEVEPGPPGTWRTGSCSILRGFICQCLRTSGDIIATPPTVPPNNCQTGYFPHGQGCYKLFPGSLSWNAAQTTCREEGAFLVTIHSHEENAVVQLATAEYDNVWIGLSNIENTGEFYWTDDWAVLYTNWGSGQPPNGRDHVCVQMNNKGLWTVRNCADFLPFVCKTTTAIPIVPIPIEGSCPGVQPNEEPWREHNGYCYYPFFDKGEFWLNALGQCGALHPEATLATIHSMSANSFVRDLVLAESTLSSIWIGLHRSKGPDPTFEWVDGSPVQFVNWQIHHPDPEPGQDCVQMASKTTSNTFQGTWQEVDCYGLNRFVCSVRKSVPPTTPPIVDGQCPEGWDHYGDRCLYMAPNELLSWYRATIKCQTLGGENATLAHVEDKNINTLIRDTLHERSQSAFHRGHWLGGIAADGNYPTWSDGSGMEYENWQKGQPEVPDDEVVCTVIDTSNALWRLSDCHSARGFVCSVKKVLLQEEEKENENGGGLTSGQSIGIAFGVILVVGILASVTIFLVLYKRTEKLRDQNAMHYVREFEETPKQDVVNYRSETGDVDIHIS